MGIRLSHCLTLWIFLFPLQSFAQTDKASVTFYSIRHSAKQQLKDAVVPVGTIPFTGWLFDGDQKLAHVQRGRFMTFHLAAGEHRFTVPYHSNRPGTTPLLLKVESGQHYCFRLSAKYKSASILLPAAVVDSQIEQVDCQQAQKEAGQYERIDLKRIDPAIRAELETSTSFSIEN